MSKGNEALVKEARETAQELISKATREADRAWYWFFAPRSWKERKLQEAREYLAEAESLVESIKAYRTNRDGKAAEQRGRVSNKGGTGERQQPAWLEMLLEEVYLHESEKEGATEDARALAAQQPVSEVAIDEESLPLSDEALEEEALFYAEPEREIDFILHRVMKEGLSKRERQYVLARYWMGAETEVEVAEILNVSPGYARQLKHRVVAKLRDDPELLQVLEDALSKQDEPGQESKQAHEE